MSQEPPRLDLCSCLITYFRTSAKRLQGKICINLLLTSYENEPGLSEARLVYTYIIRLFIKFAKNPKTASVQNYDHILKKICWEPTRLDLYIFPIKF